MDITRVEKLLEEKQFSQLKEELLGGQIPDIAEFIDELDPKTALLVFRLLPKEIAADVFSFLSPDGQSSISSLVNDKELQAILEDLYFDDKIDFLEEMPASVVKRILLNASETERQLINQFLNYPDDSAGSLMTIEFVALRSEMTVQEALEKIRTIAHGKETIYTCYVTDSSRRLIGAVSLRDLVLTSPTSIKIEELMSRDIISVVTGDDKEYTADLIKKYNLLAIPVTDHEHRLVGIITVDDIIDVIEEENTEDFHRMATVGEINTNLLSASPLLLIKRRIPWLLILVFVNIFSGAGIAYFEETIQSVIALVFFLPLLIDSAGNAGSQSATLMIRALAVGDVQLEDWFKLLQKEFLVAIPLGLLMAAAVSVVGMFRAGFDVAIVVAISMATIVIVGSTIGLCLPFVFSKLKLDPATASGPLITSIADITGVLVYFSIATWYLGF